MLYIAIYKQLLKKIVVQPVDGERVQLEFVFNNTSSPENSDEYTFCVYTGKAGLSQQYTEPVFNSKFSMKSITCIASAFIPKTMLIQKYLKNRLSTREIAEEFSCSKSRVIKLLMKYNIPLRKRSERYWYHCRHSER